MLALQSAKAVSSCLQMWTWWLQSMICFSTTAIRWVICERHFVQAFHHQVARFRNFPFFSGVVFPADATRHYRRNCW